jgi:Fanconi anemia group M protein
MPETQSKSICIFADLRERASGIPRALSQKGLEVRLRRLEIGDYILAPHIAVERKTLADFVQSIFDKRLFAQVGALRACFAAPILLLEQCDTPSREIHPSSLRGAMLYVSLLNRIPILHTENAADTVEMLFAMTQFIHRESTKEFSLHAKRRSPSLENIQRYVLETIPGIGPHLAHELLKQFGNLQAVFSATPSDLMNVPGIGRNRAEKIRALLQRDYRRA